MKFPTPNGVDQVRSNQKKARVCYVSSTKGSRGKEVAATTNKTLSIFEQAITKPQPIKALEAIKLHEDYEEKLVYVESQVSPQERQEIVLQC